jgi:hypothetical protein
MSRFVLTAFQRTISFVITRTVQLLGVSGLLLLAVFLGIFGGLWAESDKVTVTGLALTGLSHLDGNLKGTFYWISRFVILVFMLVFWVISCFIVVWLCRIAFGVGV